MQIRNTSLRFGLINILFHWITAIIVIGLLALGLYMVDLPINPQKLKFYRWHKEFGILVLMLTVVRLSWRISDKIPTLPDHLALWEKRAAHGVHYAFYGFLIAMPLTGWMISSASALPVSFFGVFVLPDFVPQSEHLRILFAKIHEWLGYGLIGIILGHTGAALQHHFIYKDNILRRMLP